MKDGIKDIRKMTDKDVETYSEKRTLDVYEKLDMVYFKMEIDEYGFLLRKAKGGEVSDVDIIVNSIYLDIYDFALAFDSQGAYEEYGEMSIGFFYLPVHKTKRISYPNLEEKTFILSDVSVPDADIKMLVGFNFKFIDGFNGKKGPYLGTINLGEWFDREADSLDIVKKVFENIGIDGKSTVSGNDVSEIEGIVLKDSNGSKRYKVVVNSAETDIEKFSKLIYRDTLLESFIHCIPEETMDGVLTSEKDYVEKVCDLFLEFVDNTDMFHTMVFEEEDLLPPTDGYIGDIYYDVLPSIVAMVCRTNPIYKNVLRILLITFNNPSKGKFDRFSGKDRDILERISEKLITQ